MRRPNARAIFSVAAGILVAGCGASAPPSESASGASSTAYGENAQEAYEHAILLFRDGNCLEAAPEFRAIRREYPYSRFAALAELRVGDCQFEQKAYTEAIQTFRTFVRFRPSHSQVVYARFKIAQSHYEQIPSDWLLAPPRYERDQGPARDALRHLRRFVRDFPSDDRVPEAERMTRDTLLLLANHELYAARFYLRLDAYPAVIQRLETLLERYEGSGKEAEALFLLGRTRERTEEEAAARQAYEELLRRFPDSERAGAARSRLAGLPPASQTPAAETEAVPEPPSP